MKDIGNARANALYNPANQPAPGNSDFQMEGYIRDKYVKKTFMDSSKKNETTQNELRSVYQKDIAKLREMGFSDDDACGRALEKAKGSFDQAIDILVAGKAPAKTGVSQMPAQAPVDQTFSARKPEPNISQALPKPVDLFGSESVATYALAPPPSNITHKATVPVSNTPTIDLFGGDDFFGAPLQPPAQKPAQQQQQLQQPATQFPQNGDAFGE